MRIMWDPAKEQKNIAKHGFDFSLADSIFSDPLVAVVYDRFEEGEHRWHAIAYIGHRCLLVVHTYPEPENEPDWYQVIGLRRASSPERQRYAETVDT